MAVSARDARPRSATSTSRGVRWDDDPLALAAAPDIDVVVELIGGVGRRRPGAWSQTALARRQARRHRQQGAARPCTAPRSRALAEKQGVIARLRGGGRRRHPDHQDAARGPGRQPRRAALRHPQRHLQLHPDDDARDRPRLRRRAGRGAAAGLRRGRSRASTSTASTPRTSSPILTALAFGAQVNFAGVHVEGIRHVTRDRHRVRRGARLSASSCWASRALTEHGIEQRVHPCMVPLGAPIAHVEGVFNAVVAEGDFVGTHDVPGPRRRGGADRLGRRRRPRRHRARARACRPSACRRRGSPTCRSSPMDRHQRRLLHAPDGAGPAGRDRGDVAARCAKERISLESMLQRGRSQSGRACRSC